jgi:hypothetical protein
MNKLDVVEQIKKYEAAYNAYDVAASMTLFAPGAQFELVG